MQQSDYSEFCDIMGVVAEQYGKTLSEGVIALYWQGLNDFDFVTVRDALGRHLRNTDTGMFMPKIADITKMLQGSTQDSALRAWAKVDKAVRYVGPHESVVFDDPLIHKVWHDMGGWLMLGNKTDDEWPFVAREFENRYRGFKARNEAVEYPAKLIGISEAHNAKEGRKIAQPMLIGEVETCKKVLLGGNEGGSILKITKMSDLEIPMKLVEMRDAASASLALPRSNHRVCCPASQHDGFTGLSKSSKSWFEKIG